MTTMTATEQLQLEMANRARMDPAAEAARLGITLNQYIQGTSPGYPISPDAKQVLAGSNVLQGVAERHAEVVWNNPNFPNIDAHNGAGDGSVGQRIKNAGYAQNPLSYWRDENFAVQQTSATLTQDQFQLLNERTHDSLFIDDPAKMFGEPGGHRLALMDPNMKEMGVGTKTGVLQGWNTVMTFQNFGVTGTQSFLTGAVYNDTVKQDQFYSVGEGVSGVTATVTNASGAVVGSDVTGSGGGWSVGQPGSTHTVTFSGGGLARAVSATVEAGSLNAKVDLVNGARIESNVNTTLGTGAQDLRLIGMGNVNGTGNASANAITGNKGANVLDGKGGNDTLDGAGGFDTAVLSGNKADYQVTVLSGNSARLIDLRGGTPDGTDTILNIEQVKFADQTVNFGDLRTTEAPAPVGSVTVNDVSVTEGNGGTKVATFTVTRTGGTAAFDVNFATSDSTATLADGDYVATSGTLRFGAGVNTQTFSVTIKGDAKVEANEVFKVGLSGITGGGTIADGKGFGTIVNDDSAAPANTAPVVTVRDVSVVEKAAVSVSTMFSASDAQGDAITKYAFWDAGSGGGHLTVGGVVQAAGKWVYVDAAQLATVKYVGGTAPGAESVFVSAYDGKAWGDHKALTATTIPGATEDFNGDGASDMLWHNDNGSVAMWQMNGEQIALAKVVGTMPVSWHVEGTEDFGGDGKSDILWQKSNGTVVLWQMDGTQIASNQAVGTVASGWHIAAVSDFTGDGKADILLNSDAGKVALWQMDGAKVVANTTFGQIGQGWQIEDAADFSGDGKADILLRHGTSGDVAMWKMNGAQVDSVKTFGNLGTEWDFAGTGDFGGDGKADILWHSNTGNVALWQMNGDRITGADLVGNASTKWDVADIGDYNRDGHSDILLQHANGTVAMWQMDGARITDSANIGAMGSEWHI